MQHIIDKLNDVIMKIEKVHIELQKAQKKEQDFLEELRSKKN